MKRLFVSSIIVTLVALNLCAGAWIRINQLGYLPKSSKVAVLMSNDEVSVKQFEIVNATTGKVVS
ncbi:MAG: hypothetical protein KBT09_01565, partial [Bacteroidales bacterium]|nr:hypothetical protein [Candidatus Sodaliphilus fimicaballi]